MIPWARILLLQVLPAGFGPLLSLLVTNSPTESEWVSLGAGIGLIFATVWVWVKRRIKLKAQLVVGIGLVLWGLKLLGWVSF